MRFVASAPGRICLFGEHQDYFEWPVVASAISLRAEIRCESRNDRLVRLHLLDLDEVFEWSLEDLPFPKSREYWLSALHIAHREGWLPERGWNAWVTSAIPQKAGASSSSALTSAWCASVAHLAGKEWDSEWNAMATWRAEVQWFDEPGGMMDQVACSMGGTLHVDFSPAFHSRWLQNPGGKWFLFDSNEPKETIEILRRAKNRRLDLISDWGIAVGSEWPEALPVRPLHWTEQDHALMDATIGNKEVSERGASLLTQHAVDLRALGGMLDEHHHWLSQGIGVSTPRIDSILKDAMKRGAWGGKINGSGGGGTGFILAPDGLETSLMESVSLNGGTLFPIELDQPGVWIRELPSA